VIERQRRGRRPRPISTGNAGHDLAVACTQVDLADRHRHPDPSRRSPCPGRRTGTDTPHTRPAGHYWAMEPSPCKTCKSTGVVMTRSWAAILGAGPGCGARRPVIVRGSWLRVPKSVTAWNKSVVGVDVLDQGSAERSPSRKEDRQSERTSGSSSSPLTHRRRLGDLRCQRRRARVGTPAGTAARSRHSRGGWGESARPQSGVAGIGWRS